MKPVFLLIPGFGSSAFWWDHTYDLKTKKISDIDFLNRLKKMGDVFAVTFPWFNVDYYFKGLSRPKAERELWRKYYKKYSIHSSDIDFTLDDLNYNAICKNLHGALRKKHPKQKIIPIGHSYGGPIAFIFARMYVKECMFCCLLDSSSLSLARQTEFFKKEEKKEEKYIKGLITPSKTKNEKKLQELLNDIKVSDDPDKSISTIYKLVSYNSTVWKINHLPPKIKLSIPIISFRSYYTGKLENYQKMWNAWCVEEPEIIPDARCVVFLDAPHFLWYDQKYSDDIINNIQLQIMNCVKTS